MHTPRTTDEIVAEIIALEDLIPTGPHSYATSEKIRASREALNGDIDVTAPEFAEDYLPDQQACILDALAWERGENARAPSAAFVPLCR